MSDAAKTAVFVAVAVVLAGLAWLTAPASLSRMDLAVGEQGAPFYPDLTDPNEPTALEVIEFDEKLGEASPFRVEFKNNRWTIPSHHNYPADAKDRLAKTAGGIIGLRKDAIVSDRKQDHSEFGVVDPFESGVAASGWGTRVKLFDKDGNVVADLIFGKDVPGKTGFKYVRVPGKDVVYAVKADDVDLSTRFADWIDRDLLELSGFNIDEVVLKGYSVDISRGTIDPGAGTTVLTKDEKRKWEVADLKEGMETDETKARDLTNAVAELKIVGVRQKPPGLKPDLRVAAGQQLALSMQARGFYLAPADLVTPKGELLVAKGDVISDQGETIVKTDDGLVYTLRFGGVLIGSGEDVTAGSDEEKAADLDGQKKDKEKKAEQKSASEELQQNRFLLVSVAFDESKFPPIPGPADEKADAASKEGDGDAKDEAKKDAKAESKQAKEKKAEPDEEVGPVTKEAAEKKKQEEEELKRKREERERKIKEGKEKAEELSNRYANWFYVISNDTFKKIHVGRSDLIKKKEDKSAKEGTPASKPGTSEPKAAKQAPKANGAPKPAKKAATEAESKGKKAAPKESAPSPKAKEADAKAKPSKAETKAAAKPAKKATEKKGASKPRAGAAEAQAKPADKSAEKKEAAPEKSESDDAKKND